jgi:TonB family protein
MRKFSFAFVLIVFCFAGLVFAQAKKPKVLKYSAPKYPPAAKIVEATGEVIVAIKIDKQGKVTEAKAESGHPLLIKAAENSAKEWIFSGDESTALREVKLSFIFLKSDKSYKDKTKFKKPYRVEIIAGIPTIDFSASRQ